MRPATTAALAAAALALLGLACSSGFTPVQPKTADPENVELRQEVRRLGEEAAACERENARLARDVEELRAELERLEETARTRRAGAVIEEEDPARPIGPSPARGIEESDLEPEVLEPAPYEAARGVGATPAADPEEVQAAYDSAFTLFHQRRYSEAELGFQRFLELYPNTELSDNALFWTGESRYAMEDFPGALEAFTETVRRYPAGNKITDAMLKVGKCFEAMDDLERAKETYRELERLFPDSVAAAAARERLANLGS